MNSFRDDQPFNLDRRRLIAGGMALASTCASPALAQQTPKKGGVFRMGLLSGEVGETLDPTGQSGSLGQMIMMMTRSALVEILPNGELGPELAESWEPNADYTSWVFNLRKGVAFHKGQSFGAADVVYSISLHRSDKTKSSMKNVLIGITNVRADGANKVIIDLSAPNRDFPFVFGDYAMRMVPEGTTSFIDGNGTGPYSLASFDPGVRAAGKRNPNYFKPNAAFFDEVQMQVIPDESARIAALRTGVIDAMDRISYKIIPVVHNLPGVKVLDVPGDQHFDFPMLCDRAPFNNPDLRMAMKYAVDREAILKLVLNGRGYIGNDQPIGRTSKYFNSQLPQYSFDADKAQFYMKKAGVAAQDFQLHAAEAAFGGAVDSATLYSQSAKKAGININVVRAPDDGYWSLTWQKVPWFSTWWSGRPTPDWMLSSTYGKGSPYNDTHWTDEKFEQLLVAARGEKDEAKRKQMYWDMQAIIHDTGGAVIPVFCNYTTLISDKLGHNDVSPMWKLDGYKAPERWWFK